MLEVWAVFAMNLMQQVIRNVPQRIHIICSMARRLPGGAQHISIMYCTVCVLRRNLLLNSAAVGFPPDEQSLIRPVPQLDDGHGLLYCKRLQAKEAAAYKRLQAKEVRIAPGPDMRLFVKLGTYKKILIVADHSWTMDVLKEKIEEREGIPRGQQRLIYQDIAMIEGHRRPGFYGITDCSTLHCIVGEDEEKAREKVDEEDPRRR